MFSYALRVSIASYFLFLCFPVQAAESADWTHSAKSGPWSFADTWQGGKVPTAGAKVLVREGHAVVYDVKSAEAIRTICISGTLSFAADRDTLLNVGLIKIQAGNTPSEHGFDCEAHLVEPDAGKPRAALEVGTPGRPIDAKCKAVIRLVAFEGQDPKSCPAIVCCGGRMDFHGAPLSRTWVKLGAPANAGASEITLAEPVTGWRIGDHLVLSATTRQIKVKKTFRPTVRDNTQTEERTIASIDGDKVKLDRPLEFDHIAQGEYRGDVANLSRNVIVESADPAKMRGHTMYHRHSAGAISYAEFRHLGKEGVLGRYSMHFHLVADTMRGSYVIGASIWDSGNRWITIHGTNYLVVRDCVGYHSLGHGFFLEDGTEVYNVLDRNLALQACGAKPLPEQVLPFDHNEGAGFWWGNSLNTFTRNVAAECDEYGFRFEMMKTDKFDPTLPVAQPDGSLKQVDARTLPFFRFEDNEAHCHRRHAFNLGGSAANDIALKGGTNYDIKPSGVNGVGPDAKHPFVVRNTRIWNVHWAFHPVSPSVLVDNMDIYNAEYAIWRPVYKQHAYRNVNLQQVTVKKEFMPVGDAPKEADFPKPLEPIDDLPPATVITHVSRTADGKYLIRGTASDNGEIKSVLVNGQPAQATRANFAEWRIDLADAPGGRISAHAIDAAGNIEPRPYLVTKNQ